MSNLKKEFTYYLEHRDELVKQHKGKFIVIKNCQVIGVYDSEMESLTETSKHHDLGSFLIQKCEPGTNSYMHMYHSRVVLVK